MKILNLLLFALLLLSNLSFSKSSTTTAFLKSEKKSTLRSVLGLPEETLFMNLETKGSGEPMENSGYLFFGYNLWRGNPHSTTGSLDPGFTNPIFESNYSNESKTGDLRFMIPNGSLFAKNVGCDVSLSNKEVTSSKAYKDSLSVDVSVKGGWGGVSFGASASYKQVSEGLSNSKKAFIESKADCRVFEGHLEYYNPPLFYSTFIDALKFLKNKTFEDNKQEYYTFIDYYGTHFLDEIVMGARFGYLEKTTLEELQEKASKEYGVGISASGWGMGASANVNGENSKSNSSTNSNKDIKIFSIGAPPSADGNAMTWAASSINEPMPISYKLRPIIEIFKNPLFKLHQIEEHEIEIPLFIENLQKAYDKYCADYLLVNNEIDMCKEIIREENKPLIPEEEEESNFNNGLPNKVRNMETKTCLTIQGENIIASTCIEHNNNQLFEFLYDHKNTCYFGGNRGYLKKALDRNTSLPTSLTLFKIHEGNNQRIVFVKKGLNLYNITIENKCLSIRGNNPGDNAPLGFDDCNGSKGQLWKFTQTTYK